MQKIDILLKRSKTFLLFLFICFTGSEACVFYSSFSILIKILLSFLNVIYVYFVYHHTFYYKKISFGLENVRLSTHKQTFLVDLSGESTLTKQMCVLRFKVPGSYFKKSCVIFRDSVTSDEFRRLLIFLPIIKIHKSKSLK